MKFGFPFYQCILFILKKASLYKTCTLSTQLEKSIAYIKIKNLSLCANSAAFHKTEIVIVQKSAFAYLSEAITKKKKVNKLVTHKSRKKFTVKKDQSERRNGIRVVAVPNYQKHLRCRRERGGGRAIPKHQKHLKCCYLSISLCRPHLLPTAQDKNSKRKSVERRWKFWPLQTHNL